MPNCGALQVQLILQPYLKEAYDQFRLIILFPVTARIGLHA